MRPPTILICGSCKYLGTQLVAIDGRHHPVHYYRCVTQPGVLTRRDWTKPGDSVAISVAPGLTPEEVEFNIKSDPISWRYEEENLG
jgi:hypothetical protein